jgi:hypothetical protein
MKTSLISFLILMSVQSFAATYTVPVSADLKDFASFELESFKSKEENGTVTLIKYKVPRELTGVEQEVEFRGTIDDKAAYNLLSGPNGILTCGKEVNEKMECRAEYKNLKFDENKAIEEIDETATSTLEASGRIAVMRAFSSDPVGIISY